MWKESKNSRRQNIQIYLKYLAMKMQFHFLHCFKCFRARKKTTQDFHPHLAIQHTYPVHLSPAGSRSIYTDIQSTSAQIHGPPLSWQKVVSMQVLAVLSIHITPCKGLAWATAIPKVFSCSRSTDNSTPEAAAVPARKASPYQTQQTLLETASAESTVLVTGWWGGTARHHTSRHGIQSSFKQ